MALPTGNRMKWPPERERPVLWLMQEHDAWYAGDPERLAAFYDHRATYAQGRSDSPSVQWWRFYSRNQSNGGQPTRAAVHVPLAGDISSTSAAMLFGEEPVIQIPEAHDEKAPNRASAQATEERLLAIAEEGGVYHRLAEAAEQASAIGGVYLKIAWDEEIADHPFVLVQQADTAIPEFRLGRLWAVTFWRVVERSNNAVIRHLERYERGVILHGLYKGSDDELGTAISLESHEATRGLAEAITLPDPTMLAVRYVPNMRPNRRFRGSELGQSDYSGAESLFDALDETMSSWMRDIRLAKARIVAPMDYLKVNVTAGGMSARFDTDQEIFSPLDVEPGQDRTNITLTQAEIRAEQFEKSCNSLIERIVTGAGYSPQTFGLGIEGRADSGTALRLRERKTQITRERKAMLWQSPLADMLGMLLTIDRITFKNDEIDPEFRARVEIKDGLPDDFHATAQSIELVSRAGAMSVEIMVRTLHPEWDADEVLAEVQRIRDDQASSMPPMPDPSTFGVPGSEGGDEGDPDEDADAE